MITNPNPIIRGKHVLPHQSQILARDLHGEDIMNKRGKSCFCYCLSDSEVEKRKKSGPYLPYKYLVYAPDSPAFSWTAFYTRESLNDFCAAYGLSCPENIEEDSSFIITIPDNPVFLPTNLPAKLFVKNWK